MARKKVVLVIVEGPSDDTALGIVLNQIFDRDSVYVHIMHGDITTKKGVESHNIVSKIGKVVSSYAKSHHYTAKDFKQIIHIVDTDGTYIPNENIYEKDSCGSLVYESDGIYTANAQSIITRNQRKRDNLYRLRTMKKIWNVSYKVYYMSCNLDHVLYDKRNSTDKYCQKGGNSICPFNTISKEAVKDLIHSLEFPKEVKHKGPKKVVETLYIDADEDHASLQFQEHKGDLEVNEYGRKKNGLITKLVYVYEGVEPVAPKSKRHRLVNPHYFCRVTNENEVFWDEIYEYINTVYDVSKIKNI